MRCLLLRFGRDSQSVKQLLVPGGSVIQHSDAIFHQPLDSRTLTIFIYVRYTNRRQGGLRTRRAYCSFHEDVIIHILTSGESENPRDTVPGDEFAQGYEACVILRCPFAFIPTKAHNNCR